MIYAHRFEVLAPKGTKMEEGPPEYFPNGSVHGSDGRGGPAYERATTLLLFRRCTSLNLFCELSVLSFADFPAKRAESPFFQ
jgi:hypothetical protein